MDVTMLNNIVQDSKKGVKIHQCGVLVFTGNDLTNFDDGYCLDFHGHHEGATICENIFGSSDEGIKLKDSGDTDFSCNTVSNMEDYGLYIDDPHGGTVNIRNNTFYDNEDNHIKTKKMDAGSISGNIFMSTEGYAIEATSSYGADITYNLFFDNDDDMNSTASSYEGVGNIWADPLFIDAENGDFSLQAGSPCSDSGDPNMSDPDGSAADIGGHTCTVAELELDCVIDAPINGESFESGQEVLFVGSASGGDGSWTFSWSSDRDGELGSGDSLIVFLSPGEHAINLCVIDGEDNISCSELSMTVTAATASIEDTPENIELKQNYPNPFNPVTTIRYSVSELGLAKLRVFNIAGQQVAVLVNEIVERGAHEVVFNAASLTSGMYFSVLESGGTQVIMKMTLLK
jgi:hypothetical protein